MEEIYDRNEFLSKSPSYRLGVRTKSWTLKGSEREHEMYSKEQREKALALYDKCHSVTKVMQSLGVSRESGRSVSMVKATKCSSQEES